MRFRVKTGSGLPSNVENNRGGSAEEVGRFPGQGAGVNYPFTAPANIPRTK